MLNYLIILLFLNYVTSETIEIHDGQSLSNYQQNFDNVLIVNNTNNNSLSPKAISYIERSSIKANATKYKSGRSVSFVCDYDLKSIDSLTTVAFYKDGLKSINCFYYQNRTGSRYFDRRIKGVENVVNDYLDQNRMQLSLTVSKTTKYTMGSYQCVIIFTNGTYNGNTHRYQEYAVISYPIQLTNNCYQLNLSISILTIWSLIIWFNNK
ncbi:uncharacterized protein LOC128959958 [Oppia nitens]|uniref:uncharacterized protein LOC128959958 n=1 Tax=Oppia nitens TaxID=1686743 RepID=UPI0023DC4900|nr:uncharacterized protein LOC128959958 [Oppia nitens]